MSAAVRLIVALNLCAFIAACGGGSSSASAAAESPASTSAASADVVATTVSPALATGSVTPNSNAPTLSLVIGGSQAGFDQDTVQVGGRARLSGTLRVRFAQGYAPPSGQQYLVLTASGGVSGRFDTVDTGSVACNVVYAGNTVSLVVR